MRRCLAVLPLLFLAGCGSNNDATKATATAAPKPASAAEFPSATGKTLDSLRAGLPEGPILAPSTTASLRVGDNRVAFALFTVDKKQIDNAEVAVYTTNHDGSGAKGPYPARFESMAVKPQFQSRTTASDPDSAKGVYVAEVPIDRPGRRVITGVAKIDGKLVQTSGFELPIPPAGSKTRPPDIGDAAPRIHTETLSDVAGDASKISTRVPPAKDLLQTDFADALGKKPIVITFATPLLCQSRVCGPVVDVVEQVKAATKGDVAFVHQEIYNGNEVSKGYRPQLAKWRLSTEPWTYVIDRSGKITARLEGAFGTSELQRAVDRVAQAKN